MPIEKGIGLFDGIIGLKYRFTEKGINTFTVQDMQWLGKSNGDLLHTMPANDLIPFWQKTIPFLFKIILQITRLLYRISSS